MKTVRRIYVEKRGEYDVCSKRLLVDFRDNLGISGLTGVRVMNRYDVQGLPDEYYQTVRNTVFADPAADHIHDEEMPSDSTGRAFAVELVPGQYDQRADSAAQAIQLLVGGERPTVAAARVIALTGDISSGDFQKIKAYYINPVESREASFDKPAALDIHFEQPPDVSTLTGFTGLDRAGINRFADELGLAMKIEDLLHCQQYFRDTEKRDPTITEIRMLDTYWSDHCRHTTFLTVIKNVEIEDAALNTPVKAAFENYRQARDYVYGDNISNKNISLMDIAQIGMKELRKKGMLDDLDVSDEINACSIVVPVVINGKAEDWLVMFKNETHNHPTEIEPFGGAATCLGGGIRDPLSGRSYVYQAMRVTGAGDPRAPVSETLPGKLPQRRITTTAAQGYSAYGNQIGVATGIVSEIYHEGYVAKRMEVGALVAAAPRSNVVRHEPKPGNIVVLLGGRTGRDGCGGATGSSKEHTEESASVCSAEVQKGNPSVEHYIQRLFRDPEVSRVIRRCNDFGAGGVSVAIGELAAGLDIDLDAVPVKYDGLDGTEIAISESQERMAVVIDPADLKKFEERAAAENLETAVVARVTDNRRLKMVWRGKNIVDLSRDFIDTNGITQETAVFVKSPPVNNSSHDLPPPVNSMTISDKWKVGDISGAFFETMSDLNVCSQRGMVEMFDSTVGASTILMPFGGKYQGTPIEAMAAKLPLVNGETTAGTAMSYGYDPYLSSWSPFHGAVYAVIHSAAKIVAIGGDYRRIRLSFQEYFERLGDDKTRWGKPFAALLGAYLAQSKLGIAAIGGKDSMSGTFKDINVPPTLISFAVAPVDVSKIISPEFKQANNTVVFVSVRRDKFEMPDFEMIDKYYSTVHDGINKGQILSVHTTGRGGIAEAVSKMCFGNRVGFRFHDDIGSENLFTPNYGGLVVELDSQNGIDANIFGLDENCKILGLTTEEKKIACGNIDIDLEELYCEWEKPLSKIFPADARADVKIDTDGGAAAGDTQRQASPKSAKTKIAKPRVLIPILPGTNCGYDMERRFTKAGAECDQFVIRNFKPQNISESVRAMVKKIAAAQIIIIPGGFGAGDGQDGSGNFVAAFFRNPLVKDAVNKFAGSGDGLILGTGSGFQALVKLGLLPYGEIRGADGENHPALTFNTVGRHISRMVYTKVRSVNSPWLTNVNFGEVYAAPISHGEARFAVSSGQLHTLLLSGQIATQYVNSSGQFEEGINGNCTHSVYAVEGLLSPDGRIFGKMGHCERVGEEWVARNIAGNKDMKIFEAGVSFFR